MENMLTLEIDGGSIESPIYEHHKRGKNWLAILVGPNAANMERQFLRHSGEIFDLGAIKSGDVIEFGADYITSGGNRYTNRLYYLVVDRGDDELKLEEFATAAVALKERNLRAKAAASAASEG